MSQDPTEARPSCPRILPIFPLTGTLLLPGSRLPLQIFEPRYRSMLEDAMLEDHYIGMVQPSQPQADNTPYAGQPLELRPDLYEVGCAGRIDRCERLTSGRYLIILEGICRFRIRRELPLRNGYRRVEASYREYRDDPLEVGKDFDPIDLLEALKRFGKDQRLILDLSRLSELSGIAILNTLAMALPFAPAEKQALLEAAHVQERAGILLSLLQMGVQWTAGEVDDPTPLLN